MAECKLCKKSIPDGTEYCIECINNLDTSLDETYLDDIFNLEEATDDISMYTEGNSDQGDVSLQQAEMDSSVDLNDLFDFEQFDISEDLNDFDFTSDSPKETEDSTYAIDDADLAEANVAGNYSDPYNNIDAEFFGAEYRDNFNNEDEFIDASLDDILKQLDVSSDEISSYDYNSNDYSLDKNDSDMIEYSENNVKKGTDEALANNNITPEDELLKLLNQFNPDDPIEEDIQYITDLLGGLEQGLQDDNYQDIIEEVSSPPEEEPSNDNFFEDTMSNIFHEDVEEETPNSDKKKGKKTKKKDKSKDKDGKSLLQRLFGNVVDENDNTDSKKDEKGEKASIEGSKDVAEASDKGKKKKKKKKDKKKKMNDVKAEGTEENGTDDVTAKDKDEAGDKKKAKKEKRKKEKIEIIEDEIDQGRINRVGASIVFAFFGIITAVLIFTTNVFSYNQNVKNASKYFESKEYAKAYEEISGLDIKDKDVELYNKVKTVMFVNKQFESFNNYYEMGMYPKALDSLLKGLKRYDKYIELATMMGIKDDLDYIKDQILSKLDQVFNLSEEEAMSIISLESQSAYTEAVYDAALMVSNY